MTSYDYFTEFNRKCVVKSEEYCCRHSISVSYLLYCELQRIAQAIESHVGLLHRISRSFNFA